RPSGARGVAGAAAGRAPGPARAGLVSRHGRVVERCARTLIRDDADIRATGPGLGPCRVGGTGAPGAPIAAVARGVRGDGDVRQRAGQVPEDPHARGASAVPALAALARAAGTAGAAVAALAAVAGRVAGD